MRTALRLAVAAIFVQASLTDDRILRDPVLRALAVDPPPEQLPDLLARDRGSIQRRQWHVLVSRLRKPDAREDGDAADDVQLRNHVTRPVRPLEQVAERNAVRNAHQLLERDATACEAVTNREVEPTLRVDPVDRHRLIVELLIVLRGAKRNDLRLHLVLDRDDTQRGLVLDDGDDRHDAGDRRRVVFDCGCDLGFERRRRFIDLDHRRRRRGDRDHRRSHDHRRGPSSSLLERALRLRLTLLTTLLF